MAEGLQNPAEPWGNGNEGDNCESLATRGGMERVKSLNQTIKNIQKVKKYLQLNSVEVKSCIHATMSRLLETLRNREVWLLDQVDVVYQAKEAVLRRQEDRLNQVLGGLTNCIELVETGAASEEELLTYVESISALDHHAEETPHITFRADMLALREIIQKFGRVDSRGLCLPGAPLTQGAGLEGQVGMSLPRHFEEYGDEEHQILYKTVTSVQPEEDVEAKIVVNIPVLSDGSRNISFLNQGSSSITNSTRSEALNVANSKPENPSVGNARMWKFGMGKPNLGNSVNQSMMKESASPGVLENLLAQESRLSRTSSLRQWLADITVGGCGLDDDDDEGLIGISESKLADLGYLTTEGGSDPAFIKSSPIEIKITSDEDDRQVRGETKKIDGQMGVELVVEEGKNEVFESFRRICQRPLSDWLSRVYAMIDSKLDQSQASTDLRYTLAAFHKVINSPVSDWLQVAPPTDDGNQSGASTARSFLRGRVDKLIDSHIEERTKNKWLIQDGRCWEPFTLTNDNFRVQIEGNSRKIWLLNNGGDKNSADNNLEAKCKAEESLVFVENGETRLMGNPSDQGNGSKCLSKENNNSGNGFLSPIGCYVKKIVGQPVSHWLDNRRDVAYENADQSNSTFNPLAAYLDRSDGKPSSYWLISGDGVEPMSDGQVGLRRLDSDGLQNPSTTSSFQAHQHYEMMTSCDIGRSVSQVPITQWIQHKTTPSKTETNIGATIASKPISDWLQSLPNRNIEKKEGSYERFLTGEVKTPCGKKLPPVRAFSVKSIFSKQPRFNSDMKLGRSRELSAGSLDDFRYLSDEESSEESFVAIGQHDLEESVSASMALPKAFCQPIERWMVKQGENECLPITDEISDVGRGVVDRFGLMQVSDWLVQ